MFLFAAFMIAGGLSRELGGDDSIILTTEVIDVSNGMTNSTGEIDVRIVAVGGLFGSSPIICGGTSWGNKACAIFLHPSTGQWTQTHTMTIYRGYAASVQLNSTTLWILGGQSCPFCPSLESTEFIGINSFYGISGPKLPITIGLDSFCAVKYSEDQVFVIGGRHFDGSSECFNRVFIFNPLNEFSHIEGPPLKTKRQLHSCGLMSNGQQTKIVVAGGMDCSGNIHSTVEIFDPSVNNWISGNKYTVKI